MINLMKKSVVQIQVFGGFTMDFKIFTYYILVCNLIEITPSFKGLAQFKKFYSWECEYNGRCKVD